MQHHTVKSQGERQRAASTPEIVAEDIAHRHLHLVCEFFFIGVWSHLGYREGWKMLVLRELHSCDGKLWKIVTLKVMENRYLILAASKPYERT